MAFEKLQMELRSASSPGPKLPASMSLSKRGKRPTLKVSLMPELASAAGFAAKTRFDFLIGKEDDAGKMRIVSAPAGRVIGFTIEKSGGLGFHLGFVPAISTKPHKRVRTDARMIEPGIVEVDIPDFGTAIDGEADETVEVQDHAAAAGGGRKLGDAGRTLNGVTIDATLDSESISFKGKSTEVTTRQAKLLQLLARPRPTPVAESFLVAALWDGKPPANAADALRMMAGDLRKGLAPIGLDLAPVKGVGYQLRDL